MKFILEAARAESQRIWTGKGQVHEALNAWGHKKLFGVNRKSKFEFGKMSGSETATLRL